MNGLAVRDALADKLAGLLRITTERCKLGPPDARHALAEAISAVEGKLRRLVEKSLRIPPVTGRQFHVCKKYEDAVVLAPLAVRLLERHREQLTGRG